MTNARTSKSTREKAAELRAEAARKEARQRTLLVGSAVAAVIVVIVAVVVVFRLAQHDAQAKTAAATAPPANLTNGGVLVGMSNAKVTVDLYEDFQCPVCKEFEDANQQQFTTWAANGTVKFEYRPVAILDRYSTTNYSTRALNAVAAVLNVSPSSFKAFHDALYANQPPENGDGLPDATLVDLAVKAGAPKDKIEQAIAKETYKGWTQTVTDQFSKKGYQGTPTVIVNGQELKSFDPQTVKDAVTKAAG